MCIKHLELKDLESSNMYYEKSEVFDEDDVMFDKVDSQFHSYWGKSIVNKK